MKAYGRSCSLHERFKTSLLCYSWLARTDSKDVARVESKTVISSERRSDTLTTPKDGVKGKLGYWMSPSDLQTAVTERFTGCMRGITVVMLL